MNSGRIIRMALVGLPLGLILGGAVSMLTCSPETSDPQRGSGANLVRGPAAAPAGLRQEDVADTIRTLTQKIGERHWKKRKNLEAAKFFLESTLGVSNLGYAVEEHIFEARGESFTNVIAEAPGAAKPNEIVIAGAHYDTAVGTPGADDNASGVAALLALARVFRGKPQARTVRFVAFTNEEPPWFETPDMGSYHYAKRCKDRGENVVAMLSLESMGYFSDKSGSQKYPAAVAGRYPKTGNFVAIVGNLAGRELVDFCHASFARAQTVSVEKGAFPEFLTGVGWSDHASFWKFGYPAVMITDTAIFRNPNYHKISDTLETLDLKRLTEAIGATALVLGDLANADLPWQSKKKVAN